MSECCKRLRDNGDAAETVLPLKSITPGDGAIRQRTAADFEKLFHDRAERANRLASAGLLCAAQTEIATGRQSLSRLLPCSGVSSCCAGFRTGGCSVGGEYFGQVLCGNYQMIWQRCARRGLGPGWLDVAADPAGHERRHAAKRRRRAGLVTQTAAFTRRVDRLCGGRFTL